MPTLGYWAIRGLGAAPRLLCAHAGAALGEVLYSVPAADPSDRTEWTDKKHSLGLEFANLPWLKDDQVTLTQSLAILTYLADIHGYTPADAAGRARVNMLLGAAMDLSGQFTSCCYRWYAKEKHGEYSAAAAPRLADFEEALGERRWFGGDRLCAADFLLYHLLEAHLMFDAALFDALPTLLAWIHRFEAEPTIRRYILSDRYIHWPLNNTIARWGSCRDECPTPLRERLEAEQATQ